MKRFFSLFSVAIVTFLYFVGVSAADLQETDTSELATRQRTINGFYELAAISISNVAQIEIRSGTTGRNTFVDNDTDINAVCSLLNSGVYSPIAGDEQRGGWSYSVKVSDGENTAEYVVGYGVDVDGMRYIADNDNALREKLGELFNKYSKTLNVGRIDGKIYLIAGDRRIEFPDAQPFIDENGRTQVPVRAVSEALGAKVAWDSGSQRVSITGNGVALTLTIGSDIMAVNGTATKMDTAAVIIDERTYVPIRYVAEAMGMTVIWK